MEITLWVDHGRCRVCNEGRVGGRGGVPALSGTPGFTPHVTGKGFRLNTGITRMTFNIYNNINPITHTIVYIWRMPPE